MTLLQRIKKVLCIGFAGHTDITGANHLVSGLAKQSDQ